MIKFGTDGWLAIIGREFTFENVEKVAQAYADWLLTEGIDSAKSARLEKPVIVGYDRRFLSHDFAKSFVAVLAANGISALLSKTFCPTPCISWMTKDQKAPGGVVITASHNPAPWNGIKFKESYGGSASPQMTRAIEEKIEANEREKRVPKTIPFEEAVTSGRIGFFDPHDAYIHQLRSLIDLLAIQKNQARIAYDPLFGAGSGFLGAVLEMPVDQIHSESNPAFGGLHPEPIAKNLSPFIEFVKKNRYDVGLATDGDADRIGAIDENGRFVNPHQIFALILSHLIEKGHRGDIVKTVSTTQMIDRIAAQHGLTVHETPIGFKHICTKFLEITPLIGGEESGGIGIPTHIFERDGLLAGLILLEIMAVKKKRLGELVKDLTAKIGPSYFERDDLPLAPEDRERVQERLARNGISRIGPHKVTGVNSLDGTKYLLEDGSWLLLRPSGTEPIIRLYAESSDPTQVRRLLDEGRQLIS